MAHARLSPSGAHRWLNCPGSIVLEGERERTSSIYADEGTVAHYVASETLMKPHTTPEALLGSRFAVDGEGNVYDVTGMDTDDTNVFDVDESMVDYVDEYVLRVRAMAEGGALLVEQRVDFSDVIGVPNSFGTVDAIILKDGVVQIHDLKYGMGVAVSAFENEQLMFYALGAQNTLDFLADFNHFHLFIHQPRKNSFSEWECTREELEAFAERARQAAAVIDSLAGCHDIATQHLKAGEKQCTFCAAKVTCPALRAFVTDTTMADFEDLTQTELAPPTDDNAELSARVLKIPLIKQWCAAQENQLNEILLSGGVVKGWKVVQGQEGNRKWADVKAVEAELITALGDEAAFKKEVISPTVAEKLLKKKQPTVWETLTNKITRSKGALIVVPEDDRRDSVAVGDVRDSFESVVDETAD